MPVIHSGWAANWDVHGMSHTTSPHSHTSAKGAKIATKRGMREHWQGGGGGARRACGLSTLKT